MHHKPRQTNSDESSLKKKKKTLVARCELTHTFDNNRNIQHNYLFISVWFFKCYTPIHIFSIFVTFTFTYVNYVFSLQPYLFISVDYFYIHFYQMITHENEFRVGGRGASCLETGQM